MAEREPEAVLHLESRPAGRGDVALSLADPGEVEAFENAVRKGRRIHTGTTVKPERHGEPGLKLQRGWLLFTDESRVAGRRVGSDGIYYLPDEQPRHIIPANGPVYVEVRYIPEEEEG